MSDSWSSILQGAMNTSLYNISISKVTSLKEEKLWSYSLCYFWVFNSKPSQYTSLFWFEIILGTYFIFELCISYIMGKNTKNNTIGIRKYD